MSSQILSSERLNGFPMPKWRGDSDSDRRTRIGGLGSANSDQRTRISGLTSADSHQRTRISATRISLNDRDSDQCDSDQCDSARLEAQGPVDGRGRAALGR